MFAASFGIRENPFKITPNLRYVYLGENFRNVRAEATHALSNRNGVVVLTARAGIGKSILLRLLAEDIEAADTASRILSFSCSPGATVDQLFRRALDRFEDQPGEDRSGAETSPEATGETISNPARGGDDHLQQLVADCLAADRPCILLIDEAQNLSDHELGRLFLLVDRVDHQGGRLRIALAGPLEFEDRLGGALPTGFERHVILRRRLEPLPTYEVAMFISERLEAAGCQRDSLFSAEAVARIAYYAEGVPRLVNTLCAAALFLAEFESRDSVTADLVDEAARHVELAPPRAEAGARDRTANDADSKAIVLAPQPSPPAISPLPDSERPEPERPSSRSGRLSLPASFDRLDRPREPDRIEVLSDWMPEPPSSSRLAGERLAGDELAAERWTSDGLTGDERLPHRPSRPWLGLLFGASATAAVFATLFVLLQDPGRYLPSLEESPEVAAARNDPAADDPPADDPAADDPLATAEPPAPSDSADNLEERGDAAPARTAEAELPAISAQDQPTPPPAPSIDPDTLAEIGQDAAQGQETATPASPDGEAPEDTPPEGNATGVDEGVVAEEAPNGASTQAASRTEPTPARPAAADTAPETDDATDRAAMAEAAPAKAAPDGVDSTQPAPPGDVQAEGSEDPESAPAIAATRPDPDAGAPDDDATTDAPASEEIATGDATGDAAGAAAVAESTAPPSQAISQPESETDEASAEPEPGGEEPSTPPARTAVTEAPAEETTGAGTAVAEAPVVEPTDAQPAAETAKIDGLLDQARRQIAALALTTPEGDNAYETYQEILALAPGHKAALQGFQDIAGKYVQLAESAERKGEESLAGRYYARAATVAPDYPALPEQRTAALPEPQPEPRSEPPALTESPIAIEPAAGPAPDAGTSGGTPQETLGQLLAQILGEDTGDPPTETSVPADRTGATAVAEQARAPASFPPASFPMPLSALEGTEHLRAAIAAGADVNTTFNDRRTPLIVAAAQRQTEMVELLLARGADPNATTRALGTPLMYAVWNGDIENIEALLQGGADVNLKNIDGKTALMAAAANGHAQIVDILLRYGAAVDSRTLNGWTPLMYAVWGRHAAVVDQLLERGADVSAVNEDGDSAARIAGDRGYFDIAAMLRSQQARNQ